jgi:rubrerythrin
MIALTHPFALLVRLAAPFAFRSELAIARKLRGFAATEAGSALDMLKAAELTDDPRLRRLFFRHGLDEARHAQLFRDAARDVERAAGGRVELGAYDLVHSTRQNLYETLGPVRFLAFVFLAESQAAEQFRALGAHFRDREALASLFARIGRDERFHVGYSERLLDELRAQGRGAEVRGALARVRLQRAWDAWRRAGRVLGDAVTHALLVALYLLVVPPFALAQRCMETRDGGGWRRPPPRRDTLDEARSQG